MIREALTIERLRAMPPAEAAAVFVARRAEGLTQSEQNLFSDWLAADQAHAREFDRADRAWAVFADANDSEILAKMRIHALASRHSRWSTWRPLASVAAAILVVLVAAALFLRPPSPHTPELAQATGPGAGKLVRYASEDDRAKAVTLPDGSTMWLDAHSAAIAHITSQARQVTLTQGRAFFAVKPNHAVPFAVAAVGQRVVAVGTRFDVNLIGGRLAVTLLQGRVTVGPLSQSAPTATLAPGQQFLAHDGTSTVRTIGAQASDLAGWRFGLMSFDNVTLAEAVAEVNRYAGDHIIVRDADVSAMRVSGQFRAGEGERFARTIAEMHHLRVVVRANAIELVPAG